MMSDHLVYWLVTLAADTFVDTSFAPTKPDIIAVIEGPNATWKAKPARFSTCNRLRPSPQSVPYLSVGLR
jgi:hypothetical protein